MLSFLKELDPANITELFWQLRPYVVLHHVEFKESSFSFSSVGIINFVDIVGFVRKNDTLGILLRNGCFYLFSAASMDRQCMIIYDKSFGYFDYDKKQAVDENSVYDLASSSKAAGTLLAVMKAYDDKKFTLNNKISDFIPELKDSDKKNLAVKAALVE